MIWLCKNSTCLHATSAHLTRTGVKKTETGRFDSSYKELCLPQEKQRHLENRDMQQQEEEEEEEKRRADLGKGQSHLPTP